MPHVDGEPHPPTRHWRTSADLEPPTGSTGLEMLEGLDLDELLQGSGQDPEELEKVLDQLLRDLEEQS